MFFQGVNKYVPRVTNIKNNNKFVKVIILRTIYIAYYNKIK